MATAPPVPSDRVTRASSGADSLFAAADRGAATAALDGSFGSLLAQLDNPRWSWVAPWLVALLAAISRFYRLDQPAGCGA